MLKKIMSLALCSAIALGATAYAEDEPTGVLSQGTVTVVQPFHAQMGDRIHDGIDLVFDENDTIYTPISGIVERVETYDDNLSLVIITNGNLQDSIVLANVENCSLERGQVVNVGDVIGKAGSNAIHFEYWPSGYANSFPADPLPFLKLNGTDVE